MTPEEPPPTTAPHMDPVRIPVGLVLAAIVLFWPLAIPAARAANRAAQVQGAGDEEAAAEASRRARRLAVAAVGSGAVMVLAVAGGLVAATVARSASSGPAAEAAEQGPAGFGAPLPEPGALRAPVREGTRTTSVHASDLRVGECSDPEGDVMSDIIFGTDLLVVDVVPCDQLHVAELVDAWSVTPSEWPDEETLHAAVEPDCVAAFEAALGRSDGRSSGLVQTWYPPIGSSGDVRLIYCTFVPPAPVTGSLQDDATELMAGV
ncbi:CD225/dispanin family protein [Antribacter sp. KLBMP9083]|uniref:CD225/dispanin family protein n=1 Tax=Antribacter soli TaxID=2910976 RepID=A0AA41U993_9MICO|nr:CD225/dispanin family protein [Antribacter soli]MCF4123733.1 CD225/dispanin family protein [Antribacter soli]